MGYIHFVLKYISKKSHVSKAFVADSQLFCLLLENVVDPARGKPVLWKPFCASWRILLSSSYCLFGRLCLVFSGFFFQNDRLFLHDFGHMHYDYRLVLDSHLNVLNNDIRLRLTVRSLDDSWLLNCFITFTDRYVRFVVYHLCQFVGLLVSITFPYKVFNSAVLFLGRLLGWCNLLLLRRWGYLIFQITNEIRCCFVWADSLLSYIQSLFEKRPLLWPGYACSNFFFHRWNGILRKLIFCPTLSCLWLWALILPLQMLLFNRFSCRADRFLFGNCFVFLMNPASLDGISFIGVK